MPPRGSIDPFSTSSPRQSPATAAATSLGFAIFESQHAADFQMAWHHHPYCQCLMVQQGVGELQLLGGVEIDVKADDPGDRGEPPQRQSITRIALQRDTAVRIAAGTVHRLIDQPQHPLWIYGLSWTQLCTATERLLGAIEPARPFSVAPSAGRMHQQLRRLLFSAGPSDQLDDAVRYARSLALLADLTAAARCPMASRGPDPGDAAGTPAGERDPEDGRVISRVQTHLDWLREHFYDPIRLDDAAGQAGLSRRAFTDAVRQVCGTSWSRHLNGLRIDHARRMLAETDRSVTSIAFECGYEDLSTFYRAYKRLRGPESPGSYRQETRDRDAKSG